VPLDVEISLEIKPRSLSGVLLSVFSHGTGPPGGDYLVLQLVNGQVRVADARGIREGRVKPCHLISVASSLLSNFFAAYLPIFILKLCFCYSHVVVVK